MKNTFGETEWRPRRSEAQHFPIQVARKTVSWFSIESVCIGPTEMEFRAGGDDVAILSLQQSIRVDGETTLAGIRSTLADQRGRMTYAPPTVEVNGWCDFETPAYRVVLQLAPPPSVGVDISTVPPALYFRNPLIKGLVQRLGGGLDGSGIDDPAYMETLGYGLVWELRQGHLGVTRSRSVRGLSQHEVKRIQDYVAANIRHDISVTGMAAVLGLSMDYFGRAFETAVGLSPYQCVLLARVRRARELLPDRNLSLADVAREVGFHDKRQLNRVFKLLQQGVSPTAYRRQLLE